MPLFGLTIAAAAFALSLLVTWIVLRQARRMGLMQVPNARSSHTIPTPSGGGIGIVAGGVVAGLPVALLLPMPTMPVIVASVLLALVGFIDDRTPLAPRWRLGAQVLLMGMVVALLPLDVLIARLGVPVPEAVLLVILTLGAALWINLFNFMDGIDGLAGSEAMFLLGGAALLAWGGEPALIEAPRLWWMLGLAAACFGFLLLNWPPARIFMGDAGSTYLGLMTAAFALTTIIADWLSPWQWLILAALFLADSLTTLARRTLNRERAWEAHKRHAYQALQRRFGSHRKATLLYILVNVLVLLPLAWLAGHQAAWALPLTILVFVVLVPAMLYAGAGAPLEQAEKERASADNGQ